MLRLSVLLGSVALISACGMPVTDAAGTDTASQIILPPGEELPLFGMGYRANGDLCRNVGESPATVELLDDSADLVACPADMENLGLFSADTGGVEVGRAGGYVLFSVPRDPVPAL